MPRPSRHGETRPRPATAPAIGWCARTDTPILSFPSFYWLLGCHSSWFTPRTDGHGAAPWRPQSLRSQRSAVHPSCSRLPPHRLPAAPPAPFTAPSAPFTATALQCSPLHRSLPPLHPTAPPLPPFNAPLIAIPCLSRCTPLHTSLKPPVPSTSHLVHRFVHLVHR